MQLNSTCEQQSTHRIAEALRKAVDQLQAHPELPQGLHVSEGREVVRPPAVEVHRVSLRVRPLLDDRPAASVVVLGGELKG